VFSVWATMEDWVCAHLHDRLRDTLAKSQGKLEQIARDNAGFHGWPSDLAVEYLTRQMQYGFKDEQREGLGEFFDLCVDSRVIDQVLPIRYYIPGS
jgi:predicted solute-binding protein